MDIGSDEEEVSELEYEEKHGPIDPERIQEPYLSQEQEKVLRDRSKDSRCLTLSRKYNR